VQRGCIAILDTDTAAGARNPTVVKQSAKLAYQLLCFKQLILTSSHCVELCTLTIKGVTKIRVCALEIPSWPRLLNPAQTWERGARNTATQWPALSLTTNGQRHAACEMLEFLTRNIR
jgi:hypothetical protein